VRILTADGLMIYGHLSGCAVQVGQTVTTGEYIGDTGNTGRSTAPHLHFEVRTGANQTNPIDPLPYIVNSMPNALFKATVTEDGNNLNVRTRPSTVDNKPIKVLKAGTVVQVIGFSADTSARVWFRLDDGFYVVYNPSWLSLG